VPGDAAYPLTGLHATAIDNIVEGSFLSRARWPAAAVEGAALVLLAWLAIGRPGWLLPGGAAMAALAAAIAGLAFVRGATLVPITEPLLAIGAFVAMAGAWRVIHESRERAITRRTFEAYFPPPVVARLLRDRAQAAGSRRKVLTVLFSDIVGFTTRSAAMSPEAVQRFLSDYLGRMVAIVFEHGGTVDKFIGDGMMVFFNDPEDQPDHAERCVRCAVAMQAAVRGLGAALQRAGEPPMQIRIGINTGAVLVGDLGSPQRLSYTAVGSAVNLAQRLESAAAPGGILVSAATAAELPATIALGAEREIRVKGLDEPVRVCPVVLESAQEMPL